MQEYALAHEDGSSTWSLIRKNIQIGEKKVRYTKILSVLCSDLSVSNDMKTIFQMCQSALLSALELLSYQLCYRTVHQVFAPANLRAAAENTVYRDLISQFITDEYTLRYTGGFVPDVHHILTKV